MREGLPTTEVGKEIAECRGHHAPDDDSQQIAETAETDEKR